MYGPWPSLFMCSLLPSSLLRNRSYTLPRSNLSRVLFRGSRTNHESQAQRLDLQADSYTIGLRRRVVAFPSMLRRPHFHGRPVLVYTLLYHADPKCLKHPLLPCTLLLGHHAGAAVLAPRLEARIRLRLGELYYKYTQNSDRAQAHLEIAVCCDITDAGLPQYARAKRQEMEGALCVPESCMWGCVDELIWLRTCRRRMRIMYAHAYAAKALTMLTSLARPSIPLCRASLLSALAARHRQQGRSAF